jgi:hypothetical protein
MAEKKGACGCGCGLKAENPQIPQPKEEAEKVKESK